jgi:hypothetical protein
MMVQVRSWVSQNHALVMFLIGQAIALGAVIVSLIAYSVRLETRVSTLEVRGSPHLERIDGRLTALEGLTNSNKASVDKIIDVLTRELGKKP